MRCVLALQIFCFCTRLNNDLLMWEPLAPIPTDTHEAYSMPSSAWDLNLAAHLMQHHDGPDSFSMCKSGVQYGKVQSRRRSRVVFREVLDSQKSLFLPRAVQ